MLSRIGLARVLAGGALAAIPLSPLNGCSAASQPAPQQPTVLPVAPAQPPAEEPASLPELTPRERAAAQALQRHVSALVGFGERNASNEWGLAAATDYLAAELEKIGYAVERQGFVSGERIAQNLVVTVPGLRRGYESVAIVASFDSPVGSVGVNDNASGVAGLLYLARVLKDTRAPRSVRLVFLSDAGDRQQTAAAGSGHFLSRFLGQATKPIVDEQGDLASDGAMGADPGDVEIGPDGAVVTAPKPTIVAALELRGIGQFSLEPGAQRYPEYLPVQAGSIGQFLALATYPDAPAPVQGFAGQLSQQTRLPIEHWVLLPSEELVADTAHRAFVDRAIPSMLLFDTFGLRAAPADQANLAQGPSLDFERMARGLIAVEEALPKLTGSSVVD